MRETQRERDKEITAIRERRERVKKVKVLII